MTNGPQLKNRRHRSYSEGTDEPRGLIDREEADVETEHPIDDTEPVEQSGEEEAVDGPDVRGMTFEE